MTNSAESHARGAGRRPASLDGQPGAAVPTCRCVALWPDRAIDSAQLFAIKCVQRLLQSQSLLVVPGEVCGIRIQPRPECTEICRLRAYGARDRAGCSGRSEFNSEATRGHT